MISLSTFFFPELLKEGGDTREEAKRRFDNWIQHGKRWAKVVEYFGSGILLLIPQDLSNEKWVVICKISLFNASVVHWFIC